ncbi:sugar phosphate isomerase/epimerase family protein [Enterocloster lavalensis]|uniref:Protein FrlC n=2 Tax=Enterocloster lavalensis TaxID=460384 RepID=A0A1I0C9C2_9FIRM|nr:TIM barrel protein [Enterocloster lavalensis]MBS5605736.1 TIM barrel protein [Enterocloster asparagiformis]MCB6342295.1 TIM barrel protein [Enterocloster lavalensis]PST32883.1 xylose isomerase [Enterocloster lavalensis]SET16025.1 protein FrlC [Enterocloster lavalensis]
MSKITMDNFAVMSVQYVHYSLEYYLDSMVKNGLKHVDLWGGIPHYCRLDYPFAEDAKKKIGSIRAMMEERGLDVSVYTPETLAYPYSFSHPEEEVRKRTVDYFSMAMDDALLFGTNKVFLNSGCGLLDLPREESFARLVDTYKKIAAIAEQKGIELVLEQLQPYESNLVLNLQDIKRVLDEVDSPAMYICVDVVAMAVAGEELKDYFEVLGRDRIKLIHFADTCHYILGDGELPLKDYLKTLEEYDYDGIVDLEINDSIYWDDPHESIRKSVEWLKAEL